MADVPDSDSDSPLVFSEEELSLEHRMLQAGLSALAAIAGSEEEFRKRIIDQGSHKIILELLRHQEPRVRASACQGVMALARSEKIVKAVLFSEGVAPMLFRLLSDRYLEVQSNAAAAICNVTLDFQRQICENAEWVQRLVELTQSRHAILRTRSVFALKNLVFMPTLETKAAVMSRLTYPRLFRLLDDEDPSVQEQAICIFRNILYKKNEDIQQASS
jgi:hypothetical protein